MNSKTLAKNLASSMVSWAKSGFKTVSTNEYKQRLNICKECDFFDKEQGRCKICGCFMVAKGWLASENCPKNLWNIDNSDKEKEKKEKEDDPTNKGK